MIGDAPQPGETPRSEGDPWSFGDPDASWWRGEARRDTEDIAGRAPHGRHSRSAHTQSQAQAGGTGTLLPPAPVERTGEEAEAHAAGGRDAVVELDPSVTRPDEPLPPADLLVPDTAAEAVAAVQAPVERDHDRPDPHRYDPLQPPTGHIATVAASTAAADQKAADQKAADQKAAGQEADQKDGTKDPQPEPDVMILPEPTVANRSTVALDRTSVPGQSNRETEPIPWPVEPLPRATGQPHTDARLEKLENSPFWQTPPDDTVDVAGLRTPHTVRTHRTKHRSAGKRRPVTAHLALVTLGLLAAFFSWVSAEPFWLAVGHGDAGYATTVQCSGDGVGQRCTGIFSSTDGRYTVADLTLLGVGTDGRAAGSVSPARMVSPDSRQAYLGTGGALLHVRWVLGFILVLICGYAVAGLTGARRLETARARRVAVLLSLAGPLALLAGFLIAAY